MLKSKLVEIKEREHLDKIEDIKASKRTSPGVPRSLLRLYALYAGERHRTGFEAGNINAVMDGDLDGFINEYLNARGLEP
jgi:peptide chain release factor 2